MKINFRNRKVRIFTAVMAVVLAYIGWEVYRRVKEGAGPEPQAQRATAVAVEIGPVTSGPITDVGQFSGQREPAVVGVFRLQPDQVHVG